MVYFVVVTWFGLVDAAGMGRSPSSAASLWCGTLPGEPDLVPCPLTAPRGWQGGGHCRPWPGPEQCSTLLGSAPRLTQRGQRVSTRWCRSVCGLSCVVGTGVVSMISAADRWVLAWGQGVVLGVFLSVGVGGYLGGFEKLIIN